MAIVDKVRAHWPIDEDNDSIGEDVHSIWDLTDRNSLTSATGKIGKCGDFSQYNQENVYHSDDSFFDLEVGYGYSLWLKTESFNDGTSTRRALSKKNQFEVYKTNAAYSPDLKVMIKPAVGSKIYVTVKSALSASAWHFLYWAVDGSNLRYSVDGETLQTGDAITTYNDSNTSFEIGNWSGTGLPRFWNSLVDEVTFWGEMLTQDEIETVYNGGAGLAYPFASSSAQPIDYYLRHLGGA